MKIIKTAKQRASSFEPEYCFNLSSDWPTQSSDSGSDSSDAYSPQEARSRPVPRATARVPGQTRRVNNNNKSSKRSFKDSDDERSRIPSRKATGNVWLVVF